MDPRTPVEDIRVIATELRELRRRLDLLESPSGTQAFRTVAKLQALVEDIQEQLDAWVATRWTNAQIVNEIASRVATRLTQDQVDARIYAVVGSILGGNVSIGGELFVNGAVTVAFAPAIWGAVTATWAFTAALLANPITWVIIGITALVAGIIWLATQTTFFQDVWNGAMTVIGAVATWLWENVLNPVFTAIGAVFSWLWTSIIKPVGDWIGNAFRVVGLAAQIMWATYISPAINAVAGALQWVWGNVIQPVASFIGGAFQTIGDTVRSIFGGIGSFIGDVFRNIVGVLRGPINTVIGFLNQAIDGANVVGQAFGVSIPRIPMLATGGTITGGGAVMVGERGPEILNLPRGASVVPLDRAPATGRRPIEVNLTQNITSEDPVIGARQAAREVARYIGTI